MKDERQIVPVMRVGRYAGKRVDTLPNSYLRWLITQDFPRDVVECAKNKLEQSDYNDLYLNATRHAVDMYSKRFLHLWNAHVRERGDEADGVASFLVKHAQEAWEKGEDASKHRHANDGVVRRWQGILFVFVVSPTFPDYKELVTVMADE